MHVLCLITYKVRSENGYGFLRPGLKTGVGNGIFGLKLGLDLEMRAAHPYQKFQELSPREILFRILLKQLDYLLLFSIN